MSETQNISINPELNAFDFSILSQFGRVIYYQYEGHEMGIDTYRVGVGYSEVILYSKDNHGAWVHEAKDLSS